MRTQSFVATALVVFGSVVLASACSSSANSNDTADGGTPSTCSNGVRDNDELGVDCSGSCAKACIAPDGGEILNPPDGKKDATETDIDCGGPSAVKCADGKMCAAGTDCMSASCGAGKCAAPSNTDQVKNGTETDVDCGGPGAPKCAVGKVCAADADCAIACGESKTCVEAVSCRPHLGGDTCGTGEVGEAGAKHESCCRTLPVPGFSDPTHAGKQVYLDKYEITVGRVRAFINDIVAKNAGKPNIRGYVMANTPGIWKPEWNKFLPTDFDNGDTVHIPKEMLGDPRGFPDETPVPPTDQDQRTGLDYQFNGQLYVYLHGNNCSTHQESYGFPTWYYTPAVLAKQGPITFPPRADGLDFAGNAIPASEALEVKSMNCISNALLQAFCAWDGGQLATTEVLDYITASPAALSDRQACGTQVVDNHPDDAPQDYPKTPASQTGGRCADLAVVNATYDAGGTLPIEHPELKTILNKNNYNYPHVPNAVHHDKAWEISPPGRATLGLLVPSTAGKQTDVVRINAADEPWMDLHGNLNEVALLTTNGAFTGRFNIRYRGIGYNSARSLLNRSVDFAGADGIRRIERPEARAAFMGGRCMRFK